MTKLHIKTQGCQMNEYDSSKMADLLDATPRLSATDVLAEEADVLLLNTCSIREAQEKVFHRIRSLETVKEKSRSIIGVGGCVASGEGEHSRQRAHYVDIILAANPTACRR